MEILEWFVKSMDVHTIFYVGLFLAIFVLYSKKASKEQKSTIEKMDLALKLQEHANHQLGLVIGELRRSNRLLAELGDLEQVEVYTDRDNMTSKTMTQPYTQSSSHSIAQMPVGTMNAMSSAGDGYKLYVGNIDYAATESELADYFAQYGQVEFVNIPVNRYTGKARGFGFVSFISKNDAERAMALHGSEFKGRQIQVNFAKERDFG